MERNGPGGRKTESLSPMIKSGVATPKLARTNIMTVIAIAAIRPASNPAEKALVLVIAFRFYKLGAKENSLFSLCGRWVCDPRFQTRQFATGLCAARKRYEGGSRGFARRRQMSRAMCQKLWIRHRCAGDDLREFRESEAWRARLSSAFRDSMRRFAPACRAFQARLAGLRETGTCRYNGRRTRWTLTTRRSVPRKLVECSCCPVRAAHAYVIR